MEAATHRLSLRRSWSRRCQTMRHRNASTFEHLPSELMSRKLPAINDTMSGTPRHLLETTLEEFLPRSHTLRPCPFRGCNTMGPGHHLVYFPPATRLSSLLPDSTDPLHSPGAPFVRRMWAGGRIRQNSVPLLHNSLGVCLERIRDVAIKGAPGEEKAVVSIERRISTRRGLAKYLGYPELRWELSKSGPVAADGLMENHLQDDAQCDIIEHRDLVFLRADHGLGKKVSRTVKMPRVPTFSHTLTPTAALLFRFSALTFNAHRIHLDREYCREVEGHRNLLVHGPLSVVLMLAILRKHLLASGKREAIQEFEYRNLAPLYAEEEMRVCIYDGRPGHHDVWIEGPDGGLAVKGTAKTAVATEGGKRGVC